MNLKILIVTICFSLTMFNFDSGRSYMLKRPINDPKTIQKRSKNDPKTIQKRSKNDPKTNQKRSKNDSKTIQKRRCRNTF